MTRQLRIAAAVSVLLHLAVFAAVTEVLPLRPVEDSPDQQPMIELRMVEQQGAGETSPATPPEPSPRPQSAAPQPRATSSDGQEAVGSDQRNVTPSPVPPAPAEADASSTAQDGAAQAEPRDTAPLEMNLGGTDSESNAVAAGENIVPASLDHRARNRPPVYPAEAVRLGQQGTVVLRIHVSPAGMATGSDILETSGVPSLDQAAQQAVATWRFVPGMKDGKPVVSEMPMRFVFEF